MKYSDYFSPSKEQPAYTYFTIESLLEYINDLGNKMNTGSKVDCELVCRYKYNWNAIKMVVKTMKLYGYNVRMGSYGYVDEKSNAKNYKYRWCIEQFI